jgi:hypothetical protein
MEAPGSCRFMLILNVLALSASTISGPVAAPSESVREMFLSTDFATIKRIDTLPPAVVPALNEALAGRKLSDPVYLDPSTQMWKPNPGDRLVFAGGSPSLWFVYYEVTEPKPGQHVVILTPGSDGKVTITEHLILRERAWSTPQLKNAIRRGEFTEVAGDKK